MIRAFSILLAALLLGLATSSLEADELRPAVIEMTEREAGRWVLEYRLPVAASQGSVPPLPEPIVPDNCTASGPPVQRAQGLALAGRIEFECGGPLAGQRFGLDALIGNSDAIARLAALDVPVQTFRLTSDAPTAMILARPDTAGVMFDYAVIGAEHILLGWDHLLFVIALVLLVRDGWRIAGAATAFTIGHSVTLVATTLGHAGLPSRPVEAIIALSIVFLAVEVAIALREKERRTWTRRAPWIVALGFGLFHGFGFAGALSDIGLPPDERGSALLAFNIGVEVGQLAVVATIMAILAALVKAAPRMESAVLKCATYAIGTVGSFWLFERVIG